MLQLNPASLSIAYITCIVEYFPLVPTTEIALILS
jgi:hypothetical protein